jgi:hypothetical protein
MSKSKKVILKKRSVSKKNNKINHRGGSIVKPLENVSFKTLNEYFDIAPENQELFHNIIKDSFGLYSIVNWDSEITYTSSNSESNSSSESNNNNNTFNNITSYKTEGKQYVYTKDNKRIFTEDAEVKSALSEYNKFKVIGVFLKEDETDEDTHYKAIILKKNDLDDYIILFGYGDIINFYEAQYYINKIIRFIYKKLKDVKTINNITLFGFSMGGNIAQHVAIKLLRDREAAKSKIKFNNINLISIAVGNILTQEDLDFLNDKLKGRIVSAALISAENINNNNIDNDNVLFVDHVFMPKKTEFKTLKSLLILINKDKDSNNKNDLDYYDSVPLNFYDDGITSSFKIKQDVRLHTFKQFRTIFKNL